jgi:hypothetical protein
MPKTFEQSYLEGLKNLPKKRVRESPNSTGNPGSVGELSTRQETAKRIKAHKSSLTLSPKRTQGEKPEEFDVEQVVTHKSDTKGLKFLIKWKGFNQWENTWEPLKNLSDATLSRYLHNISLRSCGTYNTPIISSRDSKIRANELVKSAINRNCIKMVCGQIVYLEADDANTTSYLSGLNEHKHELVAINFDRKVCSSIMANTTNSLTVYYGSLFEYIQNSKKSRMVCLWMDYCSTFVGSAKSDWSPKKDYLSVIRRKIIRPGGIIALTICTRTRSDPIQDLEGWLITKANEYYEDPEILHLYNYTGMRLIIIKL